MMHGLSEQQFTSYEATKNCIDDWIASKDEVFFRRGIRKMGNPHAIRKMGKSSG